MISMTDLSSGDTDFLAPTGNATDSQFRFSTITFKNQYIQPDFYETIPDLEKVALHHSIGQYFLSRTTFTEKDILEYFNRKDNPFYIQISKEMTEVEDFLAAVDNLNNSWHLNRQNLVKIESFPNSIVHMLLLNLVAQSISKNFPTTHNSSHYIRFAYDLLCEEKLLAQNCEFDLGEQPTGLVSTVERRYMMDILRKTGIHPNILEKMTERLDEHLAKPQKDLRNKMKYMMLKIIALNNQLKYTESIRYGYSALLQFFSGLHADEKEIYEPVLPVTSLLDKVHNLQNIPDSSLTEREKLSILADIDEEIKNLVKKNPGIHAQGSELNRKNCTPTLAVLMSILCEILGIFLCFIGFISQNSYK